MRISGYHHCESIPHGQHGFHKQHRSSIDLRIALFITCLADNYFPRSGIAVVKILEYLGHEVIFPRIQTCCGQPMYNNGYRKEACQLARRMIKLFRDCEIVTTPSGSCASLVHDAYPQLFTEGTQDHEAAVGLAKNTYEFVSLLKDVLDVDLTQLGARWEGIATYHYSCHLRHIISQADVERLLNNIEGLEYRQIESADQCCGFGGTFSLHYPDLSGSMVREKVRNIAETGAETLICHDNGCTMNIAGACRRQNVAIRIISPSELFAESLGLLERGAEL